MLENSNNSFLRSRLPLLQTTNNPRYLAPDTDSSTSQCARNPAIHSELWRIAQDQTRRPASIKRGASFSASDTNPQLEPKQQAPNEEAEAQILLTEDEFDDIDLLDLDQEYDVLRYDTANEPPSQFVHEPLHDSDMELICEASPTSTQTTMVDDLFIYESTQTTLDEFASACDPDPIPFDYSDTEMLF